MNFKNEAPLDFNDPQVRAAMEEALRVVRGRFGQSYSLIIGGKKSQARRRIRSISPSHPSEVVGLVPDAERGQADRALTAAVRAFASWRGVRVGDRADALRRIAAHLRRRKYEFCAWLIYEVGKNWGEADGDVAEAIDFLEYYAALAERPVPALVPVAGEKNEYRYLPIGPVVVIPPWNFPLAILVGMTSAAVVAGNTVVLKPSSQSPVIAAQFMTLVEEAGLPAGVINLLTGSGASIGDYLVADPRTRMVAFTGSKFVGLHINALAAQTPKRQRWIKRVIAEMGGKNAIIVDASADLEQAVRGTLASAFGYQGQKCSACSRVYIDRAVYRPFVERLEKLVRQIRIGPAEALENFMGPVISASAQREILSYMQCGKKHGRLLTGGSAVPGFDGYFLQPTIFERLSARCKVRTEEVFGPVLFLQSVTSFEAALREANASDYGLTGAVYTQDAERWRKAIENFACGNLYINRKCTGALVGAHPFGGFAMSGTDSKAGGPDYLQLFQQAQCIAQKL